MTVSSSKIYIILQRSAVIFLSNSVIRRRHSTWKATASVANLHTMVSNFPSAKTCITSVNLAGRPSSSITKKISCILYTVLPVSDWTEGTSLARWVREELKYFLIKDDFSFNKITSFFWFRVMKTADHFYKLFWTLESDYLFPPTVCQVFPQLKGK